LIYDIRHVTSYAYGSSVTYSHCALRLLPKDGPGQYVIAASLDIDPAPKDLRQRTCFFGNRVTSMTIDTAHRKLLVEANISVDIERDTIGDPKLTPSWEYVRENAFSNGTIEHDAPTHFLFPSRFVPLYENATDYTRAHFTPGRPILAAAISLMHQMRQDFRYDPKATIISTPLSEAFEKRHGVCQDFAHIMIAGLRGIGLPAAYVSGYIRTIPPEGQPRLEGADAMHAWVSLWCGETFGWIDLDPTNDMLIGNDHIVLAKGRDYADISPVTGIILGSREQDVDVAVDVVPRI